MLDLLPMTHVVTIESAAELDDWGLPLDTVVSPLIAARISYNTQRKAVPVANGEQVVYTAEILFSGIPDLTYEDSINWTDSLGLEHSNKPLVIDIKHDLTGNVIAVKAVV